MAFEFVTLKCYSSEAKNLTKCVVNSTEVVSSKGRGSTDTCVQEHSAQVRLYANACREIHAHPYTHTCVIAR